MTRLALAFSIWIFATAPSFARLYIIEIHYNPLGTSEEEMALEFIEVYSDDPLPVDISGFQIQGGIEYFFPEGTIIEPHGVVVVAAVPDELPMPEGTRAPFGPFVGRLDNGGEKIGIADSYGSVRQIVSFNDGGRWPSTADGYGPSIVLRDVLLDANEGESWGASVEMGGTPGVLDFSIATPELIVNEVSREDGNGWVEIYNPGAEAVELEGYALGSDFVSEVAYTMPAGASVEAGGFYVVREADSGLALDPNGDRIALFAPGGARVVDAHRVGAIDPEDAAAAPIVTGRYPDGANRWLALPASPGATNSMPERPSIVISEIHYNPYSEDDAEEFVELVNTGDTDVDLGGYRFSNGIRFEFPRPTVLAAGEFLVVARDPLHVAEVYGLEGVLGPWEGILSNQGEMLRLIDAGDLPVDEVRYFDEGSWSPWADGDGPSLELIDSAQDNSAGAAWRESDHSAESEWRTVEYEIRQNSGTANEFHLWLFGAGEALIDDLEVEDSRGNSLIANGNFEAGDDLGVWRAEGTHVESFVEEGTGADGSNALHLVASRRGDSQLNHVEQRTLRPMLGGQVYSVRFKVRWLRGSDLLMVRNWGHFLARTTRLSVPGAGGTPGRANSRASENTGPVISNVEQFPALPAPDESVILTARVRDSDGLSSVSTLFRLDGEADFESRNMADDGVAPDSVAGDSIYTVEIPGRARAAQVGEFRIVATDGGGRSRMSPAQKGHDSYVFTYDDGIDSGPLPGYRIVMRSGDYATLRRRSPHSNHPLPASLVYRDERIFHLADLRYKGSTFVRVIPGERQAFRIRLRDESSFHGAVRIVLDDALPDPTIQVDRTMHLLMQKTGRIPFGQRQHIEVIVRGNRFGLYEDVLVVDDRYLESSFGTAEGELYKVDSHYETNSSGGAVTQAGPWRFFEDKETLRFQFKPRSRERQDDFSGLRELLRVLDPNQTPISEFESRFEELADVDQWIHMSAALRTAADWDAVGGQTGKNVYLYRPPGGKWMFIPWDHDVAMGTCCDLWPDTLNPRAPIILTNRPLIRRFLTYPSYTRRFYREIETLLDGFYSTEVLHPILDGNFNFLRRTPAGAVRLASPSQRVKGYIATRASYLRTAIGNPEFRVISPRSPVVTTRSELLLSGNGPLAMERLHVDGEPILLEWRSVGQWRASIELDPGDRDYLIEGLDARGEVVGTATVEAYFDAGKREFLRGDVNADGRRDLTDAIATLQHL